ncbi:MAG TPA: LptF/LptG family permease [Phycisphaerae bacterium]|nr:LptF/LptG family permease [Phycisphaerae bacterium]HNU45165.1 LptF/LptG family permease [Phycisphaerae bacterium]
MTTLDRYLLRSLLLNYVLGLGIMLSLYVVLDLSINLDEFTESRPDALTLLRNIGAYYGPNLALYFAQLCGVITTFACLATVARLRVQNEMTALLSSGVSLYRVAAPIIAFGVATSLLLVLATEVWIPALAPKLGRQHDEVGTRREAEVFFMPDRGGTLLSAARFNAEAGTLHGLLVLVRDEYGSARSILEADLAAWEPAGATGQPGRWRLTRGRLEETVLPESPGLGPRIQRARSYPEYYESNLSPRDIQVRQAEGWVGYLSLSQLRQLQNEGGTNLASIVQTRHRRVATPLVSIVLLLLGLPFFLDRSPANVLRDASRALVACGACYLVTFGTQNLRPESLSALPSWIPIFIFATLAAVLLDRLRT